MTSRIAVVGSATLDLLLPGLDRLPSSQGDEFTRESLLFCPEPLGLSIGGNGANSAYALARLGVPCTLWTALGKDPAGGLLSAWLEEAGVDVSRVVRTSRATSTTLVLMNRRRDRLAFHHPGPLPSWAPPDSPDAVVEGVRALLLTSFTLLAGWRTGGYLEALRTARRRGCLTALDIGPAAGDPAAIEELLPLLPEVDVLLANRYELLTCTGDADLEAALSKALEAGAGSVVVKLGREGALLRKPEGGTRRAAAFQTATRSTVGAGDVFNAGFLAALTEGLSVEEALQWGNAAAALTLAADRGVLKAPTRPRIEEFLRERPGREES